MNSATTTSRIGSALLAFCVFGCGGRGDVSGKVTFQGKPVVVGSVVVLASDSLPYTAALDAAGEYHVANVPTGAAKFAVVSRRPVPPKVIPARKGKDDGPPPSSVSADKWFALPARYEDPTTSELSHHVGSGPNRIDLVLTR